MRHFDYATCLVKVDFAASLQYLTHCRYEYQILILLNLVMHFFPRNIFQPNPLREIKDFFISLRLTISVALLPDKSPLDVVG